MPPPLKLDVETVLLVADVYERGAAHNPADKRRDLEKTSEQTIARMLEAIAELGVPAVHIQTLEELTERAAQRRAGDLVLSIYGGERSRNRMALVPAICETYGLRFVGPDVYGRILCQDKEISKQLALQCGVLTPRHTIIRGESDLARLTPMRFPMVVKPNLEGSSIGISQRCKVTDVAQAHAVARSLLQDFDQPVLIEEFVGGAEVCLNVVESVRGAQWRLAEIRLIDRPGFFEENLFCAEIKAPWIGVEVIPIDDRLCEDDLAGLQRLVAAVGTVGYCRIDGKLRDGRFHFLELTPDAWLDPCGAFPLSFTKTGWSYPELLARVLDSERASHQHRASSDSGTWGGTAWPACT